MGELGIAGKCGRRKVRTTWRDPAADRRRTWSSGTSPPRSPTSSGSGDITYIPTDEGWLFVASVLDVCTRIVVGWSIADHLRAELCTDALAAAGAARGKGFLAGTVFHSDHGCQYTSGEFKACCEQMGITQSMGTVGDSYDNAMAEAYGHHLNVNLLTTPILPQKKKPDWLYSNG